MFKRLWLAIVISFLFVGQALAVPPVVISNRDGSKEVTITNGKLDVNATVSGGSGTSIVDDAAFTPGTTTLTPVGGIYTTDEIDAGDSGAFKMNAKRELFVVQDTAASLNATVTGSVNVGTVTTLPAITGTVTANAGTNLNTSALALDATLAKLTVAQNADLGSNTQALIGGSVTTANPSYTTAKVQPLSLATDGTLRTRTDLNPTSSTASGQKDVTTAGTDVVLGSSTAILSVTIKAKHANTGWIYVGAEGVASTTGYVLDAAETVTVDVDNLTDVWIDSSVNGEGVSYIYVVK